MECLHWQRLFCRALESITEQAQGIGGIPNTPPPGAENLENTPLGRKILCPKKGKGDPYHRNFLFRSFWEIFSKLTKFKLDLRVFQVDKWLI